MNSMKIFVKEDYQKDIVFKQIEKLTTIKKQIRTSNEYHIEIINPFIDVIKIKKLDTNKRCDRDFIIMYYDLDENCFNREEIEFMEYLNTPCKDIFGKHIYCDYILPFSLFGCVLKNSLLKNV